MIQEIMWENFYTLYTIQHGNVIHVRMENAGRNAPQEW